MLMTVRFELTLFRTSDLVIAVRAYCQITFTLEGPLSCETRGACRSAQYDTLGHCSMLFTHATT